MQSIIRFTYVIVSLKLIFSPNSPSCVDWSKHYGLLIDNNQKENLEIMNNTRKHPATYSSLSTESTSNNLNIKEKHVTILDIGCGYGGLLFNMSPYMESNQIALGLEIRDKVTNYVSERIHAIRYNSNGLGASNISVLRTNAMKTLLNYFYKGQIEKMFFCFADPHFKKYTHRRRIIK